MNELEVEIVASPDIYFGVADDSLLLFDPRDRRLHVLNNTAAMTWALTDQPIAAVAILESLASHFEVPVSQIEDEVLSVLGQLIETGLCVVGEASQPSVERSNRTSNNPDFEAQPHSLGPYTALGATVVVDVEDTRLHDELERVLAPLLDPNSDPALSERLLHYRIQRSGDGFNLTLNGETLARGTSRATCKRSVLSSLNSRPIDFIDDAIVMHAAGVEVDGRIIAFPGKSNSGKSTLATRLLSRGARYLSDEALPVAMSGLRAAPYPKSLCLDGGAQRLFPMLNPETPTAVADSTWDVDPTQIGGGMFSRGGAIGALVFPTFKVGAAEAVLEPLDRTEVARLLLANTFDFVSLGQPGFAVLVRLANTIPGFTLIHGGRGEVELVEELAATLVPGALPDDDDEGTESPTEVAESA
jgi:hypothetical protein